jgi:hypothetical protein
VSICSLILDAVSWGKREMLVEFWLENFRAPSSYKVRDFRQILIEADKWALFLKGKKKFPRET